MNSDELNRAFAALADPTRRAILARLASGEATVNQLVEPFDMTQPSISKHLKVLEQAGLISRGRAAQTRPCRLEPAPLQEIAQWVGMYTTLWEASFDRLDAFLQAPQPDQPDQPNPAARAPGHHHDQQQ
ncbi:MAG: metalloregulator ArsR/SmtB family transcription factor [Gammaproteobacteria bacterium]|nr:metalloregulator ArsR/SmtB family transcription factor [Gammaproteobacteria bacterium]